MKSKNLVISTKLQISKPAEEVFEAIVDPAGMTNYFISKSSGRMEEGENFIWNFPEFDVDVPVQVNKIIKNEYISYYWDGAEGKKLLVEINLIPQENKSTLVHITEKEMPNNEAGIKWLKQNIEGWANFLACLKAYLEHGINLRKGGFEFMKN